MRKLIALIILASCLLTGCFVIEASAVKREPPPELPEIFLPAEPAAPEPGDLPAVTPSPEKEETVPPAPDKTASLEPAPPPPAELPKLIDGFFAEYPEFSGSVLIARGNRIIFCKAYGMANADTGVENTPDTKFLVGSVTKQFTSMAVMQLYEKGLLDINDKLSKYIPDFTRGGEITLWNLLTNTSGIVDFLNDYPPIISSIPYEEVSQRRLIDLIKTQPLKFRPGEKYSYSNSNFLILGYIVEKVSGMSYGDYLAQNIFKPLGMENTGIMSIGSPPENMARGHTRPGVPVRYYTAGGEIIDDTANSVKGAYGAGRLYSTVGDLWIWDRALKTEKLISKEYIDMMFYPHVPVPNAVPECSYGFGWVIDSDPDVGTIIRHTGTLSGFRAYNGILADRGFIVIVLFNTKEFTGREDIIPSLKKILPASSISKQSQEYPPVV